MNVIVSGIRNHPDMPVPYDPAEVRQRTIAEDPYAAMGLPDSDDEIVARFQANWRVTSCPGCDAPRLWHLGGAEEGIHEDACWGAHLHDPYHPATPRVDDDPAGDPDPWRCRQTTCRLHRQQYLQWPAPVHRPVSPPYVTHIDGSHCEEATGEYVAAIRARNGENR